MNLKINQKYLLFSLSILLLVGITFSIVQIILASTATKGGVKPTPIGHLWNETENFNCPAGEFLQSNNNGALTCGSSIKTLFTLHTNSNYSGDLGNWCYSDPTCTTRVTGYYLSGGTVLYTSNSGNITYAPCPFMWAVVGYGACYSTTGGQAISCGNGLTMLCTQTGTETYGRYYLCVCS